MCLPCAWRRLDLKLWGAGGTAIVSQSAVNSVQIGQAVSEARRNLRFLLFVVGVYHASVLLSGAARRIQAASQQTAAL